MWFMDSFFTMHWANRRFVAIALKFFLNFVLCRLYLVCGILMYPFVHGEGLVYLWCFCTFGYIRVSVVVTGILGSALVIDDEISDSGDGWLIFIGRGRSSTCFNIVAISRRSFLTSFPAVVCKVVVEDGCCKILTMSSAACLEKYVVETWGMEIVCRMNVTVSTGCSDCAEEK